tara:strand:+ start:634 stop:1200 length:567 start_codon:yes stop_codon:yes gene_type:complete
MKSNPLISQLIKGNKEAFKSVYDTYKKRIYGFCINNGQSKEDAKDVLQEVFIRIWTQRSQLQEKVKLESYLFSIARNVIVDKYRAMLKKKVADEYQIYLMTPTNNTENDVYFGELKQEIEKTFESMPEMRKLVFQMSRFKGYSNKEISEELGISLRTVESHISKALQAFRNDLGQSSAVISFFILLFI